MDTLIFHSQFLIQYVYGFFKLSTYFRHGIPVSCNHSRNSKLSAKNRLPSLLK